jgi:hypothetical protein
MKCSLLVLSGYLDGELEARRQGELEAHLVGCQRCRAGLGYLREEVERVAALGRVRVADHSVHALLSQLGLIDEDEPLPERSGVVALAERPLAEDDSPWGAAAEAMEPLRWSPGPMPSLHTTPAQPDPPEQLSVDMTGSPERPTFRWVPEDHAAEPRAAEPLPEATAAEATPPTEDEPPSSPQSTTAEEGVPSVPFGLSLQSPVPQPPALEPPRHDAPPGPIPHWPPAARPDTDTAPSAPPSGGAFPPGGPEPSELPTHVTDPGGEPEMTASPPWAPRETPAGPVYPLTDDDILDEPVPVERFGPPPQAPRPSLFERLRDRIAVRRALSRSSSAYEDSVQIVSGSGAPLRPGRARLEVERRRQEALRMEPGAIPGETTLIGAEADFDEDEDLGLGPLPPSLPPLSSPMPRPSAPPAGTPGVHPGQMALPGTDIGDPLRRSALDDPRAPVHRVPMPPPRHTLGSALGDVPPPPYVPVPPSMQPPPAPVPDPLGEALAGLDRERGTTMHEARPWRPREIPEDLAPAGAPPRRFGATPPTLEDRRPPGPSQLRDGRRLLALFGAAALLMLVVGLVSGRTTSPLPSGTASSQTSAAPAQHPSAAPSAKASAAPGKTILGPSATKPSQAPAVGAPQLTSTKVLGDGGTGYQVRDFRYGIHPNDFRIVLDMDASGSASGTPKATIGFQDPTTLLVVLDGVVPAGSTGQLPSSNPVVSVTLLTQSPFPGSTVYQLKLAHPVQFSAIYAGGPLRLVLDLAG